MPTHDPHFLVYPGTKVPDSQYGQEKYATDPNSATVRDNQHFTNAEKAILARHEKRALMRYKDTAAYFCSACWNVYNVICPRCKAKSEIGHLRSPVGKDDPVFRVEQDSYDRYDGFIWTVIYCRKCDFGFRVIVN